MPLLLGPQAWIGFISHSFSYACNNVRYALFDHNDYYNCRDDPAYGRARYCDVLRLHVCRYAALRQHVRYGDALRPRARHCDDDDAVTNIFANKMFAILDAYTFYANMFWAGDCDGVRAVVVTCNGSAGQQLHGAFCFS